MCPASAITCTAQLHFLSTEIARAARSNLANWIRIPVITGHGQFFLQSPLWNDYLAREVDSS
jgi:hypothetical protein